LTEKNHTILYYSLVSLHYLLEFKGAAIANKSFLSSHSAPHEYKN